MFDNYNIGEIRILVASSELEFSNVADFRNYLKYTLPKKQEGKYQYREKGIDLLEGDADILVIFWYQNKGVGCGVLRARRKYSADEITGVYNGVLEFYPETIFNVAEISEQEIHQYSAIPKSIVQGSPKVDVKELHSIKNLIYRKWRLYP